MVEAIEGGFDHVDQIGGERSGLSRLLVVADLQDEVAAPGVGVERLGAAGDERRGLHAGGIQLRKEVGAIPIADSNSSGNLHYQAIQFSALDHSRKKEKKAAAAKGDEIAGEGVGREDSPADSNRFASEKGNPVNGFGQA